MKDIPIFTTEYGVASLALKEIPYRQEAYIRVQDAQEGYLSELISECVTFCRMAGAEKIYATGHEKLDQYPLHTSVLRMQGSAWVDKRMLENLFPVTEATVSRWRQIANDRMKDVDCAATLTSFDEKEILQSGGAYFVHRDGKLLGIGWMADTHLRLICATEKGAGERVMHTLMSMVEGAQMTLEVASTNEKAIRLYEKLGFLRTGEVIRWHRVWG